MSGNAAHGRAGNRSRGARSLVPPLAADALSQILLRYRPALEEELAANLSGRESPLYDMMRYQLGWIDAEGRQLRAEGGKSLRSGLCLLACESAGGDYHAALPAAAAVELLHNFSLIHDDIEDASPERRRRPTVWRLWGEAQAINAGDGMFALSRLALLRLHERGVPAEMVFALAKRFDEGCLALCEGQFLDVEYEKRSGVDVDAYLAMIAKKTAALIEWAAYAGAALGSDDAATVDALCRYGCALGIAFQMRDDVLGIWGEQESTGKPVMEDIVMRKKSLPVVYALSRSADGQAELARLYAQPRLDDDEARQAAALIGQLGGKEFAQQQVSRYCAQAVTELRTACLTERGRHDLESLAACLQEREH